jgi:hypothetical protein
MTMKIFPQTFGAIFNTSELKGVSPGDKVTLTVIGNLNSNANVFKFEGSDTVKVIQRKGRFTEEFENWNRARDEDLFARNYNDNDERWRDNNERWQGDSEHRQER